MGYELRTSPGVDRVLQRLPEFAAAAVIEFMTGPLLENPTRVGGPLGMQFEGYRAARRGSYRVVYRIDEVAQIVFVVRIDHRADVYRGR